jgi:hypothetical protein
MVNIHVVIHDDVSMFNALRRYSVIKHIDVSLSP